MGPVGILLGALGVGGVLGPLVIASLGNFQRRGLLQIISLLAMALTLIAFALTTSLYVGVALLIIAGFFEMEYLTTNMILLQLTIPDELRGRVTSVLMLRMGLMFLGGLIAGVGADLLGAQGIVLALGAATAAVAIAIALFAPTVRNLRLSDLAPGGPGEGRPAHLGGHASFT
jgi:hypothetical protein